MINIDKVVKFPIQFEEVGHTYQLNGKLLTGVSTVLGVRSKDFLIGWAAKEAVKDLGYYDKKIYDKGKYLPESQEAIKIGEEFLWHRLNEIKGMTPDQYYKLLEEAKGAARRKSGKAKDVGHEVHDAIEQYIKKGKIPEGLSPEAKKGFEQFLIWEAKAKPVWVASELIVCSEKNQLAGTMDALAVINGNLEVVDFKTNNQISEDAFLQTAAYQMMLTEMDNSIEIKGRRIIRVPKDGSPVQDFVVPTPYEFDRDTFLHLREVHRWNVNIENNIKQLM